MVDGVDAEILELPKPQEEAVFFNLENAIVEVDCGPPLAIIPREAHATHEVIDFIPPMESQENAGKADI
ncbi:hypothetical protein AMTR_s00021p00171070 [Amborella trichopoda]|uniref:Uncharacterized protein n=1 Tax=Amborella trichopoda TaxID=13333 RepID=W1Q0E1_AMBTC|nr:hypothetical protein AMTR_s00021p00171070 [Amborella trichopoda]